jgi:hypothetical protein
VCFCSLSIASENGWLDNGPLPSDDQLAAIFEAPKNKNSNTTLLTQPHEKRISKWDRPGDTGQLRFIALWSNSSDLPAATRRFAESQKIRAKTPKASVCFTSPRRSRPGGLRQGPNIKDVFTGAIIKTWIFVMTLCFSRHMYAQMVTNQKVTTWLACHRHAFEFFNGVMGKVIIDNPKCAITRACYRDPEVQRSYAEFAEGYGFIISPCPPRDPQKKGSRRIGVKYVKNNFVPLRSSAPLPMPTNS